MPQELEFERVLVPGGGGAGVKVAAIGRWAVGSSAGGFVGPVCGRGNCGAIDAGSMSATRAMERPFRGSIAPAYMAELKVM